MTTTEWEAVSTPHNDYEQEPVSFDPEWLYKCGKRISG